MKGALFSAELLPCLFCSKYVLDCFACHLPHNWVAGSRCRFECTNDCPNKLDQSFLFLSPDVWLFLGHAPQVEMHQHYAIQLIVGLEGDLCIRYRASTAWYRAVAFVGYEPHACHAGPHPIAFLTIEPESTIGRQLKAMYFAKDPLYVFPAPAAAARLDGVNDFLKLPDPHKPGRWRHLVELLTGLPADTPPATPADDRVLQVQHYIRQHADQPLRTHELAHLAHLSESRLLHLFKQQTGISIRKYVRWCRAAQAVMKVFEGNNLTATTFQLGFSDQPHFTKSFISIFGFKPAQLLKASRSVQVFYSY